MNDEKLEELRYYFTGYGSQHDETILKLIVQNKRYREALEEIKNFTPVQDTDSVVEIKGIAEEALK